MLENRMYVLAIAFLLDLLLGDPEWLPHPIRFIGNLIYKTEQIIYPKCKKSDKKLFWGGFLLVITVLTVSVGIAFLIISVCYAVSNILGIILEGILCYTLLATKSLKKESMKVYDAFADSDTEAARYAVSRIVGRDTEKLSEEGIVKAAVETVAENTSDGSIAPMIYLALGGAVLGFFYKAVNTMDSMVGYKNGKYLYFGRCAAKLDDIVNYIPARLSAWLMIIASFLLRMNGRQAFKIYRRDCRNHASPNSAQTESVCAGALEVELAGNAYYFGKLYEKPSIGDRLRSIEPEDIRRANQLLYMTAWLSFVILECLLWLVIVL